MTAHLEVEGLYKIHAASHAEVPVLRGVSFAVQPGEFVCVMGPSGSGKTTLLHLLSGLDQPSAGAIRLGGQDLTQLAERERTLLRRRDVGFVFQFFNLIPTLSVEENVLLPVELNGTVTAAKRDAARELLRRVGLGDRGAAFPDKLSGGEQQRVAIARALAHDPALVLADEPTGNLDAATGEQVLQLLDDMTRQAGKTLIMVTHSTAIAARADRILHLEDGRLVEHSLLEVNE